MKNCNDCEFFEGYDYSDGTPNCSYSNDNCSGYEYCPYNDCREVKKKGISLEIDTGFMDAYIRHTLQNTIERECNLIATDTIKSIITAELKEKILEEMERQVKTIVSDKISDFMSKDITIGGGWSEPERKLTRTEYLSELVEKELQNRFNKLDVIKTSITKSVESEINTYDRKLRDEINARIKTYFDTATRQILTENVVSMLMCNDTYKKLSDSMQTFLPQKSE